RLRLVLAIRYQPINATAPRITTCQTMDRKTGSDQDSRSPRLGAARAPARRGSAVISDIGRLLPGWLVATRSRIAGPTARTADEGKQVRGHAATRFPQLCATPSGEINGRNPPRGSRNALTGARPLSQPAAASRFVMNVFCWRKSLHGI